MDQVFQALSDKTRRKIVLRLARSQGKAIPMSELAKPFLGDMSLPAVSKHLKVLKVAKLVKDQHIGKQRLYSLEEKSLIEVEQWLTQLRTYWESQLDELARYFDEKGN